MFSKKIVCDEVLTELPRGKKYLGSKTAVTTPAQKGGTCWYYTFSNFRPHYGKAFLDSHPHRKIEKIFSAYRKTLTKLNVYDGMLSSYKSEKIDADQVKKHIKSVTAIFGDEFLSPIERLTYDEFLNQSDYTYLGDFVENKKIQLTIQAVKKALVQLEMNPQTKLHDYLSEHYPNKSVSKLTASEMSLYYQNILKLEATHAYGFINSPWHPADGIGALIKALRTYGACCVIGDLGAPYYTKPAHKLRDSFQGLDVYGWNPGEYKQDDEAHAITIVGAKQVGQKGRVYFIDPNDAHGPSIPQKLYVMSYERLLAGISNIRGAFNKAGCHLVKGPFAIHANQQRLAYLHEFHQFLADYNANDTMQEPPVAPRNDSDVVSKDAYKFSFMYADSFGHFIDDNGITQFKIILDRYEAKAIFEAIQEDQSSLDAVLDIMGDRGKSIKQFLQENSCDEPAGEIRHFNSRLI